MKNQSDILKFYEDAGHGWLEVSISLCRELELKISGYSYCKGEFLYLEEDCDAPAFIKAWEATTGREYAVKRPDGYYDRPLETTIYHHTSPVRNYHDPIPADLLK